MPLRMSRRIRGKPCSTELNWPDWSEHLLIPLRQGGEPLGTKRKDPVLGREWYGAYLGSYAEDPAAPDGKRWEEMSPGEQDIPWPIRRLDAPNVLRILAWQCVKGTCQYFRNLNGLGVIREPSISRQVLFPSRSGSFFRPSGASTGWHPLLSDTI